MVLGAMAMVFKLVLWLFGGGLWLTFLVSTWKTFKKAGEPGWAALIPLYNVVVILRISGKPLWWLLLLCIPGVNFFAGILVAMGIAKGFGRGPLFGLGLAFPLTMPFFALALAFSNLRYSGQKAF
jgi:hypothetical protein